MTSYCNDSANCKVKAVAEGAAEPLGGIMIALRAGARTRWITWYYFCSFVVTFNSLLDQRVSDKEHERKEKKKKNRKKERKRELAFIAKSTA